MDDNKRYKINGLFTKKSRTASNGSYATFLEDTFSSEGVMIALEYALSFETNDSIADEIEKAHNVAFELYRERMGSDD